MYAIQVPIIAAIPTGILKPIVSFSARVSPPLLLPPSVPVCDGCGVLTEDDEGLVLALDVGEDEAEAVGKSATWISDVLATQS